VTTDEGVTGIGEACNWPGDITIEAGVHELKRRIIGKDPMDVEQLWSTMYRGSSPHGLWGVMVSSLSGIDQALWDIRGKVLNAPVWQLLGGKCRDKIRVYSHAEGNTPEELVKDAKKLVSEGFSAIKVTNQGSYVGVTSRVTIVDMVRAAREAVGPDIEIGLDGLSGYNGETAIRLGKKLEPFDLFFLEEPLPPQNVDAMAKLAHKLNIPIATGEHLYTKFGFRELLEKQAADILQADMARTGGITEMKKIAAMAEAYYVSIAPHNPNGPIANFANLHFAAAIPNFLILEWLTDNPSWVMEAVTPPLKAVNGFVDVPTKPGLGCELNKEIIKKHLLKL
jgi:galactonate dehydratase